MHIYVYIWIHKHIFLYINLRGPVNATLKWVGGFWRPQYGNTYIKSVTNTINVKTKIIETQQAWKEIGKAMIF